MFAYLSDYEAGSPALPCGTSPPSPVAPSLHRAFLQVWNPSRFGPPPSSVRKGWGFGQEGWALESIAARICREGGGRVTTNVLVRDLDLALPGAVADGRRLEVVVDGLPLFGGAQLAVDTTPRLCYEE